LTKYFWALPIVFFLPLFYFLVYQWGFYSIKLVEKKSMIIGQAIFLLGIFSVIVSKTKLLIIASFFLAGFGDSLYVVSAMPLLSRLAGMKNCATVFAINSGLFSISAMVGNYLAGRLRNVLATYFNVAEKTLISYQTVLILGVVLSLLVFMPLLKISEPREEITEKENKVRIKWTNLMKDKFLLQYFLPYLLLGTSIALIVPYLNLFFVEKYAISKIQLRTMFGISALITAFFTF
jgi:MFS family permease